jgi:hypothetical protein
LSLDPQFIENTLSADVVVRICLACALAGLVLSAIKDSFRGVFPSIMLMCSGLLLQIVGGMIAPDANLEQILRATPSVQVFLTKLCPLVGCIFIIVTPLTKPNHGR